MPADLTGRRNGKTTRTDEAAYDRISAGEHVHIVARFGLRCANGPAECLAGRRATGAEVVSAGLAAFLAARLDEAEQNISYAGPARIAWLSVNDDQGEFRYTTVAAGDDDSPWCADGREIPEPASVRVVWDPARERRAIAAKRAILARYERACRQPESGITWTAGQDDGYRQACEDAITDLAAEWDDHPDYRPEWSPELAELR